MNKTALHAHDRGAERLNLSPQTIDEIQKSVDRMWYGGGHKKLTGSHYYSDIRDPKRNLLGYAAYKRIGNLKQKPRLILASILNKEMKPKGNNISNFFHTSVKDNGVKIHIPKVHDKFDDVPNNNN
jgi:hypothetical protein